MITKKQSFFLTKTKELVYFGNETFMKVTYNSNKIRMKKQLLHQMMAAHQSYTEAVLKLMEPPNIYHLAGLVLLRSLIENIINMSYITNDRSEKNTRIFIIDSLMDRKSFANKHKSLMIKYPKWKLAFGNKEQVMSSPKDWDMFIKKLKGEIQFLEKKYKQEFPNKLPSIEMRALAVDKYKGNKLKESNSLEKDYVLYYKFFSQIAHLTSSGFEHFISFDESGDVKIAIDSKNDQIEFVIPIIYGLYRSVLIHNLKEFKSYKSSDFSRFPKQLTYSDSE